VSGVDFLYVPIPAIHHQVPAPWIGVLIVGVFGAAPLCYWVWEMWR
jgi:hypothetical protein